MRPESREFYDDRASELEAALATAEEERDRLREEVAALEADLRALRALLACRTEQRDAYRDALCSNPTAFTPPQA